MNRPLRRGLGLLLCAALVGGFFPPEAVRAAGLAVSMGAEAGLPSGAAAAAAGVPSAAAAGAPIPAVSLSASPL
ncbi:MAG: hypothetical protein KGM24_03585 [Elusimicrobia bacterium]|nr:hypothetical protein [Elusimicrobiota bacterium]